MKKSIKILYVLVLFIGFFLKTFSQNCTSLNYGSSLPINSIDEEIKNVTIGTLNNTSSCASLAGGIGSILNRYSNYTGQIASPTLIQTVSYPLSITLFECGAIQDLGCVNVYIDYNQNGLFTDTGENVYSADSILFTLAGTLVSTSITIPFNAMIGTTRMRVIGSYGATMTPTGSYNYGETEDYCVTIGGSVPTPPSNDLCSGASSISCATSSLVGTTIGSVSEPPPAGAFVSNYGVWYKFIGDGQLTTISSVADAFFDQEMVILTGSSCGSFSILASQDNSSSGGTETYSFTTTNAQQYYVYIAHWNTSSNTTGNFTISRSCSGTTPIPSNDLCSGASSISCATFSLVGTTIGSVSEPPPAGAFVSNYGVWYKFIGDGQLTTISSVADAFFDQEMVILTGSSCGSFSILASQDNSSSGGTETYSFTTTNAQQYYVYIAHCNPSSNTTGNFTISRSCSGTTPLPSNDLCSGASLISCATFSLVGTTIGSVSEPPPAGAFVSNYGVWYKFIGDGQLTTISSVADAFFDQEMVILTGSSCGSFSILASQDNSSSGGTETYSFTTTNAQQYYVYIAHWNTSSNTTGNFIITRTCTPPIYSCTQLNFGSSQANFSDDEEIFNVTFGSLNNTSNCSSIAPGPGSIKNMYSNYTGSLMTPTISVGSTYMLSVTLSECGTFTYTGGVSVYIDYNANGVFTDQGENVWNNPNCDFTFGGTTYSSNILIPANTTLGYKRMRVIAAYSGTMSPTGSYSYGETEDYCIEISPNDGTSITTQNLFDLNVIVYPNPTSDQITIQLSTNNNYKILILNALGQVIYTKDAEINNSLDLINFDSGLYFLKVIDKNLTLYTTRIIKK